MNQPPPPSPAATPLLALRAAFDTTRGLLSRPGLRGRWLQLAGLAVMAGLVGAGAPCPPLGLLEPAWEDPAVRQSVLGNPWVLGLLAALALFLVGIGGFGRSFTLAFIRGIRDRDPELRGYRRYLPAGAAHYAWSSALSIPLYLLLFGLEWRASRLNWARLLAAAGGDIQPIMLGWALEMGLLLVTWTLLTFPLMIWIYELTPSVMVLREVGPVRAAGQVAAAARKKPARFWAYIGLRFMLQVVGNSAAGLMMLPALLLSSVAAAPVLGLGWLANGALGGWTSAGGAGVGSVAILLSLAILYAVICSLLVPISLLVNAFALHTVDGLLRSETVMAPSGG